MTVEEASVFKSTLKIQPLLLLFFSFSYLFLPVRILEAKHENHAYMYSPQTVLLLRTLNMRWAVE